jgi:hypothetical protein
VIEATEQFTYLDDVPVRVWRGVTSSGVPCFVFVHRIAVANGEQQAEFDRELAEQLPPGRLVSLRQVL